jgi:hypothetical protein
MKKKRLFPVFIFLSLTTIVLSQTLIPYYKNGKYGYCNLKKEIVIKPQYDGCGFFNEDRAWFKKGNKYGYLNSKGNIVVAADYSSASNFSYGMSIVVQKDLHYAINIQGRKLNKFGSEHLFRVADSLIVYENYEWYIINKSGKPSYNFEEIGVDWENRDYVSVWSSIDSLKNGLYLNLKTGEYQKEKPGSKLSYDNPDSLQLVEENLAEGNKSTTINAGLVIGKNNQIIFPKNQGNYFSGNNMQFIIFADAGQSQSQIYIADKKKYSPLIPFVISGVDYEIEDEPIGYQKILDRYYFICSLKIEEENTPSTEYVCIDEDGNVYAEF